MKHLCLVTLLGFLWACDNGTAPQLDTVTPSAGRAGDVIALSGSSFGTPSDDVHVFFGGIVEGHIRKLEADRILVTVPSGAVTGKVFVWNQIGKSGGRHFTRVEDDTGPWASVAAGSYHTCAIKVAGTLWCWGWDQAGQLAQAPTGLFWSIPAPVGHDADWASVAGGIYLQDGNTCGIRQGGALACWGDNSYGQVGNGTRNKPVGLFDVGTPDWTRVVAGEFHTCGLKRDASLYCWGLNHDGELGIGSQTDDLYPHRVSDANVWLGLAAGGFHACAVKRGGSLWCWGFNGSGELGTGGGDRALSPAQIGFPNGWEQVFAGGGYVRDEVQLAERKSVGHTCAIRNGGELWCWGSNAYGQLGLSLSTSMNRAVPAQVGTSNDWASASLGKTHSCAIRKDRSLWCWGYIRGILESNVAMQMGVSQDWAQVASGAMHACGLKKDGSLWCWGSNQYGQAGMRGNPVTLPEPVQVVERVVR